MPLRGELLCEFVAQAGAGAGDECCGSGAGWRHAASLASRSILRAARLVPPAAGRAAAVEGETWNSKNPGRLDSVKWTGTDSRWRLRQTGLGRKWLHRDCGRP